MANFFAFIVAVDCVARQNEKIREEKYQLNVLQYLFCSLLTVRLANMSKVRNVLKVMPHALHLIS